MPCNWMTFGTNIALLNFPRSPCHRRQQIYAISPHFLINWNPHMILVMIHYLSLAVRRWHLMIRNYLHIRSTQFWRDSFCSIFRLMCIFCGLCLLVVYFPCLIMTISTALFWFIMFYTHLYFLIFMTFMMIYTKLFDIMNITLRMYIY